MTSAAKSAAIKHEAARYFDVCGVAGAVPPDSEDRLGAWLDRGYHADMDWIAESKEARQDIQRKLPGARSVVVVAKNYFAPRPESADQTRPWGRVSNYAWGRDYHRVLHKPVERLSRFIETLGEGARTYHCVDSGPVLEKFWAARAGVGWIGKNSLALRRDLGSWFFLGVIFTTVELEPDSPMPDQCGTCRLCMDACPTGAIVEPRVVDARCCISYQTIENRGEIPPEIRAKSRDWVFGCDICQEVCPYNRKPVLTSELDFHPRPGHAQLDLAELLALDETAFRERFAGTPIMRAKLTGMRRNARSILNRE